MDFNKHESATIEREKYVKMDPKVPGIFKKIEKAFSLWVANVGGSPFDLLKMNSDELDIAKTGYEAYTELRSVLESYEDTVYKQTIMLEEMQESINEMNKNIEALNKKVTNKKTAKFVGDADED